MRLAVFGGSGRTGSELLRLAAARGWSVQALMRPTAHASAVIPADGGHDPTSLLTVWRGSLDSPADVLATIRGVGAVVCVFGPRSSRAAPFCAAATKNIVDVMKTEGPRRLLCMTGAMAGELVSTVSRPMRVMAALYRRSCPELAADVAEQERVVITSGLDWTLVKPPRLTNGRATGAARASQTLPVGLTSRISRCDVASFLLDEAEAGRHIGERVYVCQ